MLSASSKSNARNTSSIRILTNFAVITQFHPMRVFLRFPLPSFPGTAYCLLLFVALAQPAMAQSGQEAQGMQDTEPQQETKASFRKQIRKTVPAETAFTPALRHPKAVSARSASGWDQAMKGHFAPQQPHRPIPAILALLGVALMLLWAGLLVGTILATGTLGLVFLILTIAFAPLLIIGIIFLIGGLVAAFSGGEKRQKAAGDGTK